MVCILEQSIHKSLGANVQQAELFIGGGAGALGIGASVNPHCLIEGRIQLSKLEMLEEHLLNLPHLHGRSIRYRLEATSDAVPLQPMHSAVWDLRLNLEVPLTLRVRGGKQFTHLDLRDLIVGQLELSCTHRTKLVFPESGQVWATVRGGAETVELWIPSSMAAFIHVR